MTGNQFIKTLFNVENAKKAPAVSAMRNTALWDRLRKRYILKEADKSTLALIDPVRSTYINIPTDMFDAARLIHGDSDQSWGVVKVGPAHYASEIPVVVEEIDAMHSVVQTELTVITDVSFSNGRILACTMDHNGRTYAVPQIGINQENPVALGILLCGIYHLWNLQGASSDWGPYGEEDFHQGFDDGDESTLLQMANLWNMFEQGVKSGLIKLSCPENRQLDLLSDITISIGTVVGGNPVFICGTDRTGGGSITVKEARELPLFKAYAKSMEGRWTPEEEQMIQHMPDAMRIPEAAIDIATDFILSQDMDDPIVNFRWRGVTGAGKSTGCKILSDLLHTPYLDMTCKPDTKGEHFTSSLIPITSDDENAGALPGLSDILDFPDVIHNQLTGEILEDISPETVYAEVLAKSRSGSGFHVKVENYYRGLLGGYIVEVAEASRMKGYDIIYLNGCDKPGARLQLANGSFGFRSKQALVIFTDNIGLSSTRPVEQTAKSRMGPETQTMEIPKEDILYRCQLLSGLSDELLLERMYNIWLQVRETVADLGDTTGVTEIMQLTNWAKMLKIRGASAESFKKTFERCIANPSSENRETIEAVMDAVSSLL